MYHRPQLQPKAPARRTAQTQKFPAPTKGWIRSDNLDSPETPNGAYVLDNWFPTATSIITRRGSDIYATLGDASLPVTAIFDYNNGNNKRLFASTATTVYDITIVSSPINYHLSTGTDEIVTDDGDNIGQLSTGGLEVIEGLSGGDWVTTQFATTGGTYLIAVNGQDPMQLFDGDEWFPIDEDDVYMLTYDALTADFEPSQTITGGTSGATAFVLHVEPSSGTTGFLYITDVVGTFEDNELITSDTGSATADGVPSPYYTGITGVDTRKLCYVWSYKNRLYFIEKESFNVWYLKNADAISGEAEVFPMGGEFSEGGRLLMGSGWSLDSSGEGGLSEQCVFITDEGQVSVYQGLSPEPDQGWSKVGTYKIGKPMGQLAWMRAGGDIIIATDIGYIPLSQAVNRDIAALSPSAVSYPIETAWNDLVRERRALPWHCAIWPEQQMAVIATPTDDEQEPMCLVANARTGAWARFTGWDMTCLCVFDGRMFFGSKNGRVVEAYVTGLDEGQPFTASVVPQFIDMGTSGARKVATFGMAAVRGPTDVNMQISAFSDYNVRLPAAPSSAPVPVNSVWGGAVWGASQWGGSSEKTTEIFKKSVSATGYSLAPGGQVTSGSIVPLDAELVRLELLYVGGELIS